MIHEEVIGAEVVASASSYRYAHLALHEQPPARVSGRHLGACEQGGMARHYVLEVVLRVEQSCPHLDGVGTVAKEIDRVTHCAPSAECGLSLSQS
jgi:hypothetical protein